MVAKVNEVYRTSPPPNIVFKERIESDDFSFALKRVTNEDLAGKLTQLVGEITEWGKRIAKHPEIKDLRHYRGLIKDFINEVITNSHEFSRENFLDRKGRHRVYGVVRIINKELDNLAKELLESEVNSLTILEITDQIRGLLLDLLV